MTIPDLKTWINNHIDNGRDKDLFWNLFDLLANSPRTTNHAESYHSHQKNLFRAPNVPLGEWLGTSQLIHNSFTIHVESLKSGTIQPKSQNPISIWVNQQIHDAKLRLFQYFQLNIGKNVLVLDNEDCVNRILQYLGEISQYLGDRSKFL
uniref:Uncharacterized protein n=1 Tax=Acrobeloides nanus TaxID=290746 RepID=A0A914D3N1_9BILA